MLASLSCTGCGVSITVVIMVCSDAYCKVMALIFQTFRIFHKAEERNYLVPLGVFFYHCV